MPGANTISVFRPLLPKNVAVVECDPRTVATSELLPAERRALGEAVEKRVREYAAGRACARSALAELGCNPVPAILRHTDRSPIWPAEFVGSISHTASWGGAAVASRELFLGLGIDVEPASALKERLLDTICLDEERPKLREAEKIVPAFSKVIFSAKEAAYKAQYALSQTYLPFSAMRIEYELAALSSDEAPIELRAIFKGDVAPFSAGQVLEGWFCARHDLVATAFAIPANTAQKGAG